MKIQRLIKFPTRIEDRLFDLVIILVCLGFVGLVGWLMSPR